MLNRTSGGAIAHHPGPVAAGDTLVVQPQDVAIFARHGALVRVLQPGQYAVPAEFAGDFEVYFVSTGPIVGVKLGGQIGLPNVRVAFGTLTWQIVDAEKAVKTVLGQDPEELGRHVTRMAMKEIKMLAMKSRGEKPAAQIQAEAVAPTNAALGPMGVQVRSIDELTLN